MAEADSAAQQEDTSTHAHTRTHARMRARTRTHTHTHTQRVEIKMTQPKFEHIPVTMICGSDTPTETKHFIFKTVQPALMLELATIWRQLEHQCL